eukprot:10608719-Karenia_brevis.AAC.1
MMVMVMMMMMMMTMTMMMMMSMMMMIRAMPMNPLLRSAHVLARTINAEWHHKGRTRTTAAQ